jgi:argininosuccinate lyase
MKGLPLAYNRDMQEDKEPAFDAADTLASSLRVVAGMVSTCSFDSTRMSEALRSEYITATELADYLVRRGIPFREAHEITGQVVAYCVEHGCELDDLDVETLQGFSSKIEEDVIAVLSPFNSIGQKRTAGSTAPDEVQRSVEMWIASLKERSGSA